jgi:hypothetical protein
MIMGPFLRSTSTVAEQGAACLRVLVRASWTIRYAARSRSRGNRSPGSIVSLASIPESWNRPTRSGN